MNKKIDGLTFAPIDGSVFDYIGTDPQKVGRVSIRKEGDRVNAYYALPDTLEGALLLFSVNEGAAQLPGMREKIIDMGRHIVSEILIQKTGKSPSWGSPACSLISFLLNEPLPTVSRFNVFKKATFACGWH